MDKTKPDYLIRIATTEDYDNIATFMRTHFYKYEPMNQSLGLTRGHTCTDTIIAMHALDQGICLVAVTTNTPRETVIGVCLNGSTTKDDHFDGIVQDGWCNKYKRIIDFVLSVDKAGDVWEKTGACSALDLHVLCVDASIRQCGLARELVEASVKMATERGYPLVTITCTSHYSARLVEKMGMKCLYSVRYDEYLAEDGKPVFCPEPPHECARVFAMRLNSSDKL